MFHLHRWEESGRHFQESTISRAKGIPPNLVDLLLFGMTTVELRCERCGLVKAVHYAGDSRVRR